jgi:hypothetical protein
MKSTFANSGKETDGNVKATKNAIPRIGPFYKAAHASVFCELAPRMG